MIFNSEQHSIFYEHQDYGSKNTLILIHGFGGDSSDWDELVAELDGRLSYLLLDLPGCGKSEMISDDRYYSFEGLSKLVSELVAYLKIEFPLPCGYSAGGRLVYYLTANEIIPNQNAFIVISSTPGIPIPEIKIERAKQDILLAQAIQDKGIAWWVDYWLSLKLFDGLRILSDEFNHNYFQRKLKNNAETLAKYLRYSGLGVMEPQQEKLRKLDISGLLLSGGNDLKYSEIAGRVIRVNKKFRSVVVQDSWHALHIEKPKETAVLIIDFIKNLVE
jgi:2-succinyl-6-hydroxy-2,4-cyclohexadiene-1-carboxylate synthase